MRDIKKLTESMFIKYSTKELAVIAGYPETQSGVSMFHRDFKRLYGVNLLEYKNNLRRSVVKMYAEQGLNDMQIALKLGISKVTVTNIRNKFKIPPGNEKAGKKPITAVDNAYIKKQMQKIAPNGKTVKIKQYGNPVINKSRLKIKRKITRETGELLILSGGKPIFEVKIENSDPIEIQNIFLDTVRKQFGIYGEKLLGYATTG